MAFEPLKTLVLNDNMLNHPPLFRYMLSVDTNFRLCTSYWGTRLSVFYFMLLCLPLQQMLIATILCKQSMMLWQRWKLFWTPPVQHKFFICFIFVKCYPCGRCTTFMSLEFQTSESNCQTCLTLTFCVGGFVNLRTCFRDSMDFCKHLSA